ncbi:MAG: DUF4160 domain-containing protein [Betaproteobacteria bacterium]|nr:DUF4160 domain-containing protein [Betaproteobacteria bacterium]
MPSIKGIGGPYRIFFYSFDCGEPMHVHVQRERMVCKFWLRPVALGDNDGFAPSELNRIRSIIVENLELILEAWNEHCGD